MKVIMKDMEENIEIGKTTMKKKVIKESIRKIKMKLIMKDLEKNTKNTKKTEMITKDMEDTENTAMEEKITKVKDITKSTNTGRETMTIPKVKVKEEKDDGTVGRKTTKNTWRTVLLFSQKEKSLSMNSITLIFPQITHSLTILEIIHTILEIIHTINMLMMKPEINNSLTLI